MDSKDRFNLSPKAIIEAVDFQKEQEIINGLPANLSNEFLTVAQIYSNLESGKDWQLPEAVDPHISADLHLIKILEPLKLEKSLPFDKPENRTPTQRRLTALAILNYCYSPKEMAKRTGLTAEEIESTSHYSRQAVALAGTELLKKAYDASPTNGEVIDPDSFSRPYVVFITPEDIRKLGHKKGYGGLVYERAKMAIVTGTEKLPFYMEYDEVANRAQRLFMSIHEMAHLLRLYQKEQLHYEYIQGEYELKLGHRVSGNLEEGGATLLTILAGSKCDLDFSNDGPTDYNEAAKRITEGLVPKLVNKAQERWSYIRKDFFTKNVNDIDSIRDTISAQIMLGDFSLLYRLTQSSKVDSTQARWVRTKLKGGFTRDNAWAETSRFLSDQEIFGVELDYINPKWFCELPTENNGNQVIGDTRRGVNREVSNKIGRLPVLYNDFGKLIQFTDEDHFEVYDKDSNTWQKVNTSDIDISKQPRLRVNYLDVYTDYGK
ncbi:hypothetical protein A2434_00920 [Candidatus Woesebacteria bacterium RIFOXYC1_FULL_41_14]|uniref:Uncharacterized protein n=4 Tax=Bacteria candidate phyla TaxID=1783234 RepID=A0A0G0RPB8_9BACT|nr:MAG: hypothetical protein UT93_C0035G0007 [Candidatus Woesebacteria bacterium GW2011_GWF1_40_24]KKS05326.1 MAG: hypothetical protein UU59_C0049G0003 [candidate division WWE3 bacterium GW2011_GWE1_41_27]OGM80351.1 MAG: hypothetical protein A2393_00705 [Candidatus Woesebacteria bacterium RIFOXYB1_FULL_41_13]OGM85084.1 MAG: hypothetical protein A2434_00920 [Candidatus Woesebacteria bacterium RIFOXYC1_FULL_41_14]OGM87256.1 MAG: hypothetical protein A2594_01145 [Candidatus Woesebacteria bacterium